MPLNALSIARELQAMAQTGLHFSQDPYDRERYNRLAEIAAEMLSQGSNQPVAAIREWQAAEFGYATPKVDTRAFILRDGKLLLIRENADGGKWTLPGGWADVNECPSSAIVREVKEETGYSCRVHQLLAVWDREQHGHEPSFPFHVYKLFFHCEITGGQHQPNVESSELHFFEPGTLPELSVSRVQARQLHWLWAKVRARDVMTDFD
ncbi:MAG: hypothetical protein E1N59_304 [Puniceicoccaceae bacterium 5H]|nr:MAG: hypothetical protein E1N59_304 [Puniceicoccaceae bacterium 5H]